MSNQLVLSQHEQDLLNLYDSNSEFFYKMCLIIESSKHISFSTDTSHSGKHKHHIIPRFYFRINNLNIDNSNENVILLTPFEHALIHFYSYKCCKLYKSSFARSLSIICRTIGKRDHEVTERWIENHKKDFEQVNVYSKMCSVETRKRISDAKKGIHLSEEHKRKISEGAKGHKPRKVTTEQRKFYHDFFLGRSFATDEGRKKMSIASKNRIITDEARKHYSEASKGHKLSDISKNKISMANRKYTEEQVDIIRECMKHGMKRMDIIRTQRELDNLSKEIVYRIMKRIESETQ